MSNFVFWALITMFAAVFVAIVTDSVFWAAVPYGVAMYAWVRDDG